MLWKNEKRELRCPFGLESFSHLMYVVCKSSQERETANCKQNYNAVVLKDLHFKSQILELIRE